MIEEPEANSEAEAAYEELEAELLAIIGGALLATAAFDSKTLNKAAQDVYRKVNKQIAQSRGDLDKAALNDLIGSYVLDALSDASGSSLDAQEVLKSAEKSAYEAYGRYVNDARYMADGMASNARRDYLRAARKAVHKVDKVGTRPAMAEAIAELAQKGVTAYTYTRKDGVEVRVPVDVGIRRAIQSNDNLEARGANTLDVAAKTTGLVEVSTTAGARKSHARWQGKVYQLEGSSKEYPNFYKACKWGDPVDGIGGYNCQHRFRVYYPSMGKQFKDPLEGTGYTTAQVRELKTQQRAYENNLRKMKREREVLKKLNLDTKDVNKRLRNTTDKLNKLITDNPKVLKRERWRETIYEKARKEVNAFGVVQLDRVSRKRIGQNLSVGAAANSGNKRSDKVIVSDKQFGKKVGKHAQEFGFDPSTEEGRAAYDQAIRDIIDNAEEELTGKWRSQSGLCKFFIKGDNVVIINSEEKFVSAFKGAKTNAKLNAIRAKGQG